tara:strand:+ start:924 stop:1271 length:348 start_codon:yes stop_codon:yes gene_type:complete
MNRKVTSFSMSGENLDVFEKGIEILKREDVSVSEFMIENMKKLIKEHGDGNPTFTLDHFTQNKEFQATPALFRDDTTIRDFLIDMRDTGIEWNKIGQQIGIWVSIYNSIERGKVC